MEHSHHHIYDTNHTLCDGPSAISDAYDSSPEEFDYDEDFYDPVDIQLEPRRLHKPKASNLKQRSETKILLPILRTSRKRF
ncbi:hypothetical protein EC968_009111, partial [Mortierella alpina]